MGKILTKKFLFLLASFLFIFFIYFSYLVAKESFTQIDFDITVKLQDKIPSRFDLLFSFFSVLGSAEVTGIIWVTLFIIMIVKRFFLSAFSLFLLPLALGIEVFGKLFVHHPAPPYLFYKGVLDVNFPLHFTHTDYSYPSGHLTRTAFLAVFLVCYVFFRENKFTKTFFIPLLAGILVVMSVSRIYLGEHWTSDVIGGFLIGASFGLFAGITVPVKKLEHSGPDNP